MSRHTENKEEILKIYGSIDLINQRIDYIENNHLKHIQKSIDRIQWIITAIGLGVLARNGILAFTGDQNAGGTYKK